MFSVKSTTTEKIEIKKSIFIADIIPVDSKDEAISALNVIKHTYFDAKHHCYAYVVGRDGNEIKFSDDGEPSQTAGVVIYNAIKQNNLTNVLIVVTRYFGGILLGAGGLTRAYSQSASGVILKADKYEIKEYVPLNITFAYTYTDQITKLLSKYNKTNSIFGEKVTLVYDIIKEDLDDIESKLIELTNGSIIFNK